MFRGYIETDDCECLSIRDEKHHTGKALLVILSVVEGYCDDFASDDTFAALAAKLNDASLCTKVAPLRQAYYSGDWEYAEDEYEFFKKRYPNLTIAEYQFKKAVQQIKAKWTDIKAVIDSVDILESLFDNIVPDSDWYNPIDITDDLKALKQTLQLLQSRGAEKIRIKFV